MTFEKGQSGNPSGRPKGSSQAEKLRQAIEADVPAIIQSMVEAAKAGDTGAAKLLLDRVIPSLKSKAVAVPLEGIHGLARAEQGNAIINAMGSGQLSPEQAQTMLAALNNLSKVIESDEFERRITALENQQNDA